MEEPTALKKTPLYDRHTALGAKIVDFSGWAMPVYYSGILAEHEWVRKSCGVFDVSHLGEIHVKGPGAFQFLQARLTNDLNKLKDNKILYSLICDEQGFTLDDILIYQSRRDDYSLIVNGGSIGRVLEGLEKYVPESVALTDRSDDTACVAIQGPRAEEVMRGVMGYELRDLNTYFFKEEKFNGQPVWISRSGYTGEDGFEIFSSNGLIVPIWDRLLAAGREKGILPAGLGARNTLRLEAGNVLYGNELDTATTPLEAGLDWAVSLDKPGGFVGRDCLLVQRERGPARRLVGFRVLDKPVAREHYPIFKSDRKIGTVTSGSFAPTVGGNIGMGYVEKKFSEPGTGIEIEIHGRRVPAEIVKLPFVPHKKRG
ncbi:MAG: glycine cleavage system aminomethyltransferase GcvT [Candidatus Omnitrophica bacterium]|nr:glycine cleavage system aminomethyltransferase GcvT [Candidatus Omnitrophota bacterium]